MKSMGSQNNTNVISALETLERCVSLPAVHDSAQRYPPPKCHPKTRIAVQDRILKWVTNADDRRPILWLHGPAGAGKSSIAQSIAEQCSQNSQLAASFFFSRSDPARNTHHRLFSTIAYQLALYLPEMRPPIEKIVNSDPSIPHKSMDIQLQKLILDPLRSVAHPLPMTIIIDGLDECNDPDMQCKIIQLLAEALRNPFPLCILIASRPELLITEAFDEYLQTTSTRLSLDDSFQPNEDITTFLKDEFDKIYNKHRRIMLFDNISKPWPSANMIRLIVKKSSGQFIYAATLLKFIDDKCDRPNARLETVLSSTTHHNAFSDLDDLYSQILEASGAEIERLKDVIAGALLVEPMSGMDQSTFIEKIFRLRPGDIYLTLQGLHSLFKIPPETKEPYLHTPYPREHSDMSLSGRRIRTFHASLPDYFRDPSRSGKFFIDFPTYHRKLATFILIYYGSWMRHFPNGTTSCYGWIDHCLHTNPDPALLHALESFAPELLRRHIEPASGFSFRPARLKLRLVANLIAWVKHHQHNLVAQVTPPDKILSTYDCLQKEFSNNLEDSYLRYLNQGEEIFNGPGRPHLVAKAKLVSNPIVPVDSPISFCFGFWMACLDVLKNPESIAKLQDASHLLHYSPALTSDSLGMFTEIADFFHPQDLFLINGFPDFIRDPSRSHRFCVDLPLHQAHLVVCLLNCMADTTFSKTGLDSMPLQTALIKYGERHWSKHLRLSSPLESIRPLVEVQREKAGMEMHNENIDAWLQKFPNCSPALTPDSC